MSDDKGQHDRLPGENERLQRRVEELEAEAALRESEAIYRPLFDNMMNGFAYCQILFDQGRPVDFIYLTVNHAFEAQTGLKNVVGRKVSEVIPGIRQGNPELLETYGRVAATGRPEVFETHIEALDMWFAISVYSPKREHFVAVFDVITERKRAEEALRASEQRLRRFYESGLLGVIYWNVRGQITEANDKFLEMVGYTRAELDAGQIDWLNMTPPEYRQLDENSVAELKTTGVNRKPLEKEYIRKDGTRIPVAVAGAMLDEDRVNGVAFVQDIAERARAEEAVRESEERNRTTLQSLGDAVISTDGWGRIAQMNPVAERLTGWLEAEVRGRPLESALRIVNGETRAVVESPVARVLREGQVVELANHTILIAKNGEERPIADSSAPIRNANGKLTGVVLVFRDQTEERVAQRTLRASERQYRTLVESLPHLVWTCRADGLCDYLSPRWVDYTGTPEADQLGYGWLKQLHPDDRERVIAEWGEGAPRGGVFDIEFRIRRADGAYRWFKTRAIPFLDEGGRVVKWFGSNSDIDDQKRVHEALRESEERARATLYSIGDAVMAVGSDSRIIQMNPVAERLTGWTEAEARNKPLHEVFRIINEESRAEVESPVGRVLRDGMVVGLANHTLLVARDGSQRPIADSGAPIRNEEGATTGVVLVFRDQTEERRVDREIRAAEERFRNFFDNAPIGKSMTAPDGKLLRVNSAFGAMLGYSVEEMQTISFSAITHPDDLPKTHEGIRSLLAGELDTWTTDKRYLARDGRQVWTHVTSRLQRDDEGKPLHLLTHIEDITERKRAEDLACRRTVELTESQRRLTDAQAVAHLGSWEWDAVGDKLTGSEEFYRLFEVVPDALTRFSHFSERLHPDDRERVRQDVEDALKQKRPYDTDYRVKLGNGTYRDINARGLAFTDRDGKAIRMAGTCLDITERKRAARDVESLAKFPRENPNPVLRVGHDGRIIYANPSSEALLVKWGRAVGDPLPSNLRDVVAGAVADGKTAVANVGCNDRIVSLSFTPIPGADCVNIYGLDVTERVRAEKAVRLLNTELEQRIRERTAELEEANRELEAFSYSVSHDLRAPLRAIDGFTRILVDEYAQHLDKEAMRLCSVVRENAKSMSQLIDDLLAFSRLGRAEMSLASIDMGPMANAIFHELTTPESRARIDFQVGPLPLAVADPTLMRQVWMNLLSNAIKFSSKQERAVIKVSAQQAQGETVYAVADDGAGFEMQYVGKLFGVFQRLHSAKDFEGTGVGLALVQRVIRRHGGRVWATGEPDKGATFCFALQQRGACL